MDSLSEKGFGLDSDQILSYSDPVKDVNVYIGKASDQALIDTYKLPKTAFVASDEGTCALTLLILLSTYSAPTAAPQTSSRLLPLTFW